MHELKKGTLHPPVRTLTSHLLIEIDTLNSLDLSSYRESKMLERESWGKRVQDKATYGIQKAWALELALPGLLARAHLAFPWEWKNCGIVSHKNGDRDGKMCFGAG